MKVPLSCDGRNAGAYGHPGMDSQGGMSGNPERRD
jgi:hypothetical protein